MASGGPNFGNILEEYEKEYNKILDSWTEETVRPRTSGAHVTHRLTKK